MILILDLALLGAHAKKMGNWFRQKDVRAVAEHLWTIGNIKDDLALHNTQILRRLEGFVLSGVLGRQEGPEYKLTSFGCLSLFRQSYEQAVSSTNFQEFLLTHYFVSTNKDLFLKIFTNDACSTELREILNPRQLIESRLNHLRDLEAQWQKRLGTSSGLIMGERLKKLWNPTLEEIKLQKQILSGF